MKKYIALFIIMILTVSGSAWADNIKRVAVLPFAVNSSESIDYIRDGVMDMLISRICVDDKIEVIGKSAVSELTAKIKKKAFTQSDAYVLGKKLKADYVVWGSITKIGNSMSIDGKLVDLDTKKSPVGVFVQSQGMDEVVPRINDFAKRIDMHILGQVPESFEPVASPAPPLPAVSQSPALPQQQQQQAAALLKEPQAAETLRTKKGTLTAAINPDFIQAGTSAPRKGFWMSDKINTQILGMDIGDVDNDGKNEIVVIDKNSVMIYRKAGKALKLLQKIKGKSYDQYISVDVADINGTGTRQIFVSSINQGLLDSFVLEYKNEKFVRIASDLRWFLRVIHIAGKPVLLGQVVGNAEEPFATPISELEWRNGAYVEIKTLKVPTGLSVYDFVIDPLDKGGPDRIVTMDKDDYIRVFEETDKPLENLIQFFTRKEMLWKSDDRYGGTVNTFETLQNVMSKSETKPSLAYANIRMIFYDLYNQGKKDLIVVKNNSAVGRVLKDVKLFTSSEIVDLEWTGLGFSEVWKTKKINGYISDIQIKDVDNDGKNELVLALSVTSSASFSPKSVIVAYSLDIKKPEQTQGLTFQ